MKIFSRSKRTLTSSTLVIEDRTAKCPARLLGMGACSVKVETDSGGSCFGDLPSIMRWDCREAEYRDRSASRGESVRPRPWLKGYRTLSNNVRGKRVSAVPLILPVRRPGVKTVLADLTRRAYLMRLGRKEYASLRDRKRALTYYGGNIDGGCIGRSQ